MAVDVTITTRIGRTPADVFAALIAVERFPEWLIASGIVGVTRADDGPLAVGSRLTIRQVVAGRSAVIAAEITALSPATTLALTGYPQIAGTASSLLGMVRFGFGGIAAPLVGVAGAASILPLGLVTVTSLLLAAGTFLALATRPHAGRSTTPAVARSAQR